jgi:glutamate N-acetyltransferase / amino-acid N-acetyltransferase
MFNEATRFAPLPGHVSPAPGSVTCPAGFRAAGVHAGIKRSRRDVGLLVSDVPAVSAAFFTRNRAAAAPVLVTRETCDCASLQAVVVNSGNANACTGERGHADAVRMRALAAELLALPAARVAVSSTGVIGEPLPMPLIDKGVHRAAGKLATDGGVQFAAAIRTTDRTEKQGALSVDLHDGEVHLGFAAKGAGMISPNMATTLCFVTCDAALPAGLWHALLAEAVGESFNRITVDGQESTNDMVLGMANGASGLRVRLRDRDRFAAALRAGLLKMALAVVGDGEGASTTVRLRVRGAHDDREADRVARAIADSPLVKTAIFGRDANWGRVVQAAGMALSPNGDRPLACDVAFDDLALLRRGERVALSTGDEARLGKILGGHEVSLTVDLNRGDSASLVYFSDLTHDYVRINAGLRT